LTANISSEIQKIIKIEDFFTSKTIVKTKTSLITTSFSNSLLRIEAGYPQGEPKYKCLEEDLKEMVIAILM
jgi:hypothetical protein